MKQIFDTWHTRMCGLRSSERERGRQEHTCQHSSRKTPREREARTYDEAWRMCPSEDQSLVKATALRAQDPERPSHTPTPRHPHFGAGTIRVRTTSPTSPAGVRSYTMAGAPCICRTTLLSVLQRCLSVEVLLRTCCVTLTEDRYFFPPGVTRITGLGVEYSSTRRRYTTSRSAFLY